VVQPWTGQRLIWVQRVRGLQAEAGHAVLDQVGAHHACGQARLPGLVDHVAAAGRLEVRRQRRLQRRQVHALRCAAALSVQHDQRPVAGRFDAPHADAAVAPVLLEHARALPQPLGQFGLQLREAVDSVHVAAEGQIAGLEQHILGAQALDGLGVRADEHTRLRHFAQQRIEPVAAPAVLDRVAPHEHGLHTTQLLHHLGGEVVVIDRRLRVHAGGSEGLEEGCKAARRRVRSVAGATITGIQQGDPGYRRAGHGV
jgi:hypothetical protein